MKHSEVSREGIQTCLVDQVAELLETPPDTIDIDEHLVHLGLSSFQAVHVTVALEEYLGRSIDPALLWEYSTIRQLSQHLASET